MKTRFNKNAKVFDIVITAVAGMASVGIMLYGVGHFGLENTWPELVLNLFYIACLVMIWMYFFNRMGTQRFNYWCSISVGVTILLRDILFAPPLANYLLHLFLCAQGLEELLEEQPVVYLRHRCDHSHTLPNRHHVV